MTTNTETTHSERPSQQEARSMLRESFLRALSEMHGQNCRILTFEKSSINAQFVGYNIEGNVILVKNLKTPTGSVLPSALLRTPDLISIHFEKPLTNT